MGEAGGLCVAGKVGGEESWAGGLADEQFREKLDKVGYATHLLIAAVGTRGKGAEDEDRETRREKKWWVGVEACYL